MHEVEQPSGQEFVESSSKRTPLFVIFFAIVTGLVLIGGLLMLQRRSQFLALA